MFTIKQRRRIGKNWFALISLILLAGMLFAGCAPQATPQVDEPTEPPAPSPTVEEITQPDEPTEPPAPSPTVEEVVEPEEITLSVWTRLPCELWEELLSIYEAEHPHVTIENSCFAYDDLLTVWPSALQAGNPPDVGMVEVVYPGLPAHVEAGWIMNLADIVEERNWRERYSSPSSVDFFNSFSIYDGGIYSLPTVASNRGLFYNKDILESIGGTVPEMVEDLEALCDDAIAAGYTCLGLGNLAAWGSEGYWINLAYTHLAIEDYEGFRQGIFDGAPGVPWGGEAVRQALETFVEWESKGYFNPEYNAIAENDIPQEFLRGDMLFLWYWSEANPTFVEADPEFEIGFVNFPSSHPDAPVLSLTNPSSNWSIPADSAHPEEAIEFLDWLLMPERGQWLAEQGLMPLHNADYSAVDLPAPWIPEQVDALSQQIFMGWPNFSTPGLAEVTGPEVQKLLAGEVTLDDVLTSFQEAYVKGAAEVREE